MYLTSSPARLNGRPQRGRANADGRRRGKSGRKCLQTQTAMPSCKPIAVPFELSGGGAQEHAFMPFVQSRAAGTNTSALSCGSRRLAGLGWGQRSHVLKAHMSCENLHPRRLWAALMCEAPAFLYSLRSYKAGLPTSAFSEQAILACNSALRALPSTHLVVDTDRYAISFQ